MKRKVVIMFTLVAVLLTLAGCLDQEPQTQSIADYYPGDIHEVDRIVIVDGNTGYRKQFVDPQIIQSWIDQIHQIRMVPDPNQEPRDGFLYAVALYQNKEKKLGFTPNHIEGLYVIHNAELLKQIEALFNSKPD